MTVKSVISKFGYLLVQLNYKLVLILFLCYSSTLRFISQGVATKLINSMTAVEGIVLNQVFQGREDRFHGITVDSAKEPCDVSVFPKKLEGTLLSRYN